MTGILQTRPLKNKTIVVAGGGTGPGKSMGKYFLGLGAWDQVEKSCGK
jgi:hypothetical protein